MRFYWPIAKVDGEQHMVWGYASTEAKDEQEETVSRQALAEALDDYMRFANIREMHQPSAVGIATEAKVDDKGLYIGAKIVDPEAWAKVVEGVYKGFSIGGRVTARDAADRRLITGLRLTEISVVDRPANPEAVFDCWKRSSGGSVPDTSAAPSHRGIAGPVHLARAEPVPGAEPPRPRAEPGLDLHKIAALSDAVAKLADAILPRLDALHQRVDEIARTPLPPQTMARGFAGLSKWEDGGAAVSADDIVAALARMSAEERTLALIKAAHANPIRR